MNTRIPSSSHFLQNGWNLGSENSCAGAARADCRAAQPEFFTACSSFPPRARELQRAERDANATMRSGTSRNTRECLVVDSHHFGSKVAVALYQCGLCSALRRRCLVIHFGDALGADFTQAGPALLFELHTHELERFRYDAVAMHVIVFTALPLTVTSRRLPDVCGPAASHASDVPQRCARARARLP